MGKNNSSGQGYQADDKLLIGLLLAVITFGMFAQTVLNIATTIRTDLEISVDASNTAVSLAALFSGLFIVVLGSFGDRFGRIKITKIGLILSIIGSLLVAISPKGTPIYLLIGRIIQGISSACIMPNAMALIKAYYEGPARQRAVSVYSIGSWGGSALSSLFGGIVASTIGWRWIFWISIGVAVISFFLISGVPESKNPPTNKKAGYDIPGIITFMVGMLSINILINQGGNLGWLSPKILGLGLLSLITFVIFYKIEKGKEEPFIDLDIFKNKTYKGATISNFLLNNAAGTLIVTLSLVQLAADLTSLQAGFLTIGYLIGILIAIKVGEKLLQKWGARRPMILGCSITAVGILLNTFTHLLTAQYKVVATIGFTLFGIGLGLYATPSADAALTSVPKEKAGSASGIYRMASSLGAAIGIAISAAIFTGLSMNQVTFIEGFFMGRTDNISIRYAAIIALLFNLFMTMLAIISISLTVPNEKTGQRD